MILQPFRLYTKTSELQASLIILNHNTTAMGINIAQKKHITTFSSVILLLNLALFPIRLWRGLSHLIGAAYAFIWRHTIGRPWTYAMRQWAGNNPGKAVIVLPLSFIGII